MTIKPINDHLLIKLEEVKKLGDLDVAGTGKRTIVEFAEVIAIGPEVKDLVPGDKVFVKGWGIDTFKRNGEDYNFVSMSTNAICGIATE